MENEFLDEVIRPQKSKEVEHVEQFPKGIEIQNQEAEAIEIQAWEAHGETLQEQRGENQVPRG